ncbi:CTP synthetase [Yoonia algicola]|uniref:CTP synthetase n=1 Tax=Yoonia algicola TaxID=3137368 RepID=A0AAN0MI28_9RHOB
MLRLASMLYSIIGTTMAGTLIIAALTAGYDTLVPILIAAGIGAVAGIPISYLVAQAITKNKI